ncbi:MAG: hypothetical protein V7746_24985 [Halioglobus sp.]
MEKIVYLLWGNELDDSEQLRQCLCDELAPILVEAGAQKLRVNVVDSAVAPAQALRIENSKPAFDAVISLWLDTSIRRTRIEHAIEARVARMAGYLVTESEPIVNTSQCVSTGERTPGMNEVVLLQKPPRLSYPHWIDVWLNGHTQVAIDTQSTFGYRQNIVVRPLTYLAPPIDAIIEENFPEAAMTDRRAFYDAVDDEALYKEREQAMIDSCMRFIDFDKIDCIPTSEYNMN